MASKWVCRPCFEWIMQPIWYLGGDCEVKTIAPAPGTKCHLFACSKDADSLLSLPDDEYVARLRARTLKIRDT